MPIPPIPAKSVVAFGHTSSPELRKALEEIREAIILPSYLSEDQRRKIYSSAWKARLEREPVTLAIDDDVHSFQYRDYLDLPNTNLKVKRALRAMKTRRDFLNLEPLLEGVCKHAGRKLDPAFYPEAVRRAARAGALDIVLDCALLAKRTGFRLDKHETVAQLMTWVQREAVFSGWDKKELKKALKRIQWMLEQMEGDPEHMERRKPDSEPLLAYPLYRDPIFLAARLHLEAALAIKYGNGVDEEGDIAKHANQLMQLWPETADLISLHPPQAYTGNVALRYLLHKEAFVWITSPVLNGLRLAARVVEPKLAEELEKRASVLEKQIDEAIKESVGGRGEELHQKLLEGLGEPATA